MKTWTNPSVEELDVKLTAYGKYWFPVEKWPSDYVPDYDWVGPNPVPGNGDDDDENQSGYTPS